jgi:hypothetical protein
MNSVIAKTESHERDHSLRIFDLPDMMSSGGKGILRLFDPHDLRGTEFMSTSSPTLLKKPVGTLLG